MAIRFCDNEVYCINKSEISREKLISFFFKNDLRDIVYVTNEEGKFDGIILYKDLIDSETAEEAIQKDKVVFNEDLWVNARNCFQHNANIQFLPVVNENNELEYLCYNDPKPNYLLNKIRRLSEIENLFLDIDKYSNIQCINIYDLNEIGFYLYQFLKKNNIAVNLYGEKWRILEEKNYNSDQYMELNMLNIYAEGVPSVKQIKKDINELLLNDITGYFEFIGDIYKENREQIHYSWTPVDWDEVWGKLKNDPRPIILEGQGWMVEKAYDFLLGKGIIPQCFSSNEKQRYGIQKEEFFVFGIPIYNINRCLEAFPDAIYLLVNNKNTLSDRIEDLEYYGYYNENSYYILTDYMSTIPENALANVISSRKTVFIGDSFLCGRLYNMLLGTLKQENGEVYYVNPYIDSTKKLPSGLLQCSIDDCMEEHSDSTYFLIEKLGNPHRLKALRISKILNIFRERNIKDFSLYYLENLIPLIKNIRFTFYRHKKATNVQKTVKKLQIKDIEKVIYGVTQAHTGNVFIRSLLEVHPEVVTIQYNTLNNCLLYYVEELSENCTIDNIPDKLINMINLHLEDTDGKIKNVLENVGKFKLELKEILENREYITGQELFVAIHIAYFYMEGKVYRGGGAPVIYWEPHHIPRTKEVTSCYHSWLKNHFKDVFVLNLVRNSIQTLGSKLRDCFKVKHSSVALLEMESYTFESMDSSVINCITVRFEDIKLFPRKVLSYLCKVFGITCSEEYLNLIETGNLRAYSNSQYTVTGLDLRPVYNQYEEYFSSFDIFRLNILFSAKHKAYGYPYQDKSIFTKQQILEWFKMPFKFESCINFGAKDFRDAYRYQMYSSNVRSLNLQEHIEINKDFFSFDNYFKIE